MARCLESLSVLDYPKERIEVIVADGRSVDNTAQIARHYGAEVVINEKEVVVSGRNRGFARARGEIIAFTDADCVFEAAWAKNAVAYFGDAEVGGIGGPTLSPADSSAFELAVDALFAFAGDLKSTTHLRQKGMVREVSDIPGCNCFYRRQALLAAMPVEESFLTAEDVWMNRSVRCAGYRLLRVPDVVVWHYRRSRPVGFLRQMYRFAIGRLQVGKRDHALLNPFHIVSGLALPLFALSALLAYIFGSAAIIILSAIVVLAIAAASCLAKTRSLAAALYMPLVLLLFFSGWSSGFIRELFFPLADIKGK